MLSSNTLPFLVQAILQPADPSNFFKDFTYAIFFQA